MKTLKTFYACLVTMGLFMIFCQSSFANCDALNVYDSQSYPKVKDKGRSISVKFRCENKEKAGCPEDTVPFNAELHHVFIEALQKSQFFSSITEVAGDETASSYYTLEVDQPRTQGLGRVGNLLIGSFLAVGGRLFGPSVTTRGEQRERIVDWECFIEGVDFKSNQKLASNNMGKVGTELTTLLFGNKKIEKELEERLTDSAKEAAKEAIQG